MSPLFFEDFTVGETLPEAEVTVMAEDAAWFSDAFGVIPTSAGEPRGLPGFYVSALAMRLVYDAFLHRTAALGAPGIEEVAWPSPVEIGDRLRLRADVTSARASRSRPDMGLVGFAIELVNQRQNPVMTQRNVIMVTRRPSRGGA